MLFLNQYKWILFTVVLIIASVLMWSMIKQALTSQYIFKTSSQTVIKELRSLNRLETASFTLEKVIDAGTSGNQFQQFLFGDRILLIAHGEVVAGFDLSKLDEQGITVEGKTLKMTLPPPQILSASLDPAQTRVYDRRQGVLSKGDKNLESEARNKAEELLTEAACTGGILNEASKNGRAQLTALFKTLGFTTVILNIPSGSC